jgi:hypothetical protein
VEKCIIAGIRAGKRICRGIIPLAAMWLIGVPIKIGY